MGTKVRYCKGKPSCGPIPIEEIGKENRCPKCRAELSAEAPGKLNYFRFTGFAPDQEATLKKLYGPKPLAIPFTFPGHPANYITVGRECYQGKFLHCCNYWAWGSGEGGKWTDCGKASRRVEDTMRRIEIDCRPERCPFAIGTEDKSIKPGQCGEVIIANLWLYELDGWDLVRFKSGGINTINNFQDAVRKMLVLMSSLGDLRSLKLELRIRSKSTKYPTESGGMKSTTINEAYVHWPNNPADLAKALTAGTLTETDVYVALPSLGKQIALPAKGSMSEPESTFDELVDGPRQTRSADPVIPLRIGDLPGREEPIPVQADPPITEDQQQQIRELVFEYVKGGEGQYREEISRAKRSIGYKGRTSAMNYKQADGVITWLKRRKQQVTESAAISEAEREREEKALFGEEPSGTDPL
jgi:hypothetical protein